MAASVKELRAKRANVIQESRKLVDKIDAEARDWTGEENAAWDKYNKEIDAFGAQIERVEKLEKFEADLRNPSNDPNNLRGAHGGSAVGELDNKPAGGEGAELIPAADARNLAIAGWFINQSRNRHTRKLLTDRHRQAARQCRINFKSKKLKMNLLPTQTYNHMRKNVRAAWDGENQRYNAALSSQQGTAGGVTVPEGFMHRFEMAQLAYGYMDQVAEHIRTDTAQPLPWPMGKDTSNKGRRLNQSAAIDNTGATTALPTFSALVMYAYKYTTDGILVPYELLRDSAFDLAGLLAEMFGERLGRVKNDDFTTGTGGDQPKGIMNAAVAGVTAAAAAAIKFDEVIDLEHSVDPAYRDRPGVGYMCHDGIVQYVRKLKDGQGKYLWQQSANSGEPDRLNNRKLTRNQSMQATVATGTKTLLFGDLSAYKIREVGNIRMYRLVERQRENDQDEFLAFTECDGNLLDPSGGAVNCPVKYLLQP